jgi:hypothetical protein
VTFAQRHISLTFQIGEGAFGASGANTVKVQGLRASAKIAKAGGTSNPTLNLRVWGLSLSLMNQLSTLGKPLPDVRKNVVTVEAGSDDTGMAVVFVGIIQQAWASMQGMPDAVFTVQAAVGLFDQMRPLAPTSINGAADVAMLISGLATQMGYAFENSGVSVQLSHPYFSGTGMEQVQRCAEHAGINLLVDNNTIAIWPKDGARGGTAVLVSKDTGMIGYPDWTAQGVAVTTLFNPNITYGGTILVQSDITPAVGKWSPFKIEHDLDSEVFGGHWFTRAEASVFGTVQLAAG